MAKPAVLFACGLLATIATSCGTTDLPVQPTSSRPAFEIQDGAHNSGNPHFYFLPPLVSATSFSGTADGTLSPVVDVCEWSGTTCVTPIAEFSKNGGTGPQAIRYDTKNQQYVVNWRTDLCSSGPCTLDPTKTYRLRAFVGAAELGHADLVAVADGSGLRSVNTGQFIGLIAGSTLPIKFRIERGAVTVVQAGGVAFVGPNGGSVASADGNVALTVPRGALSQVTPITIAPGQSFPAGGGAWSSPVDLGPSGTTFAVPAILTLRYDPTQLPFGVTGSALRAYVADGTGWELIPEGLTDAVSNTVSAPILHFSTYTLTIAPTVIDGIPSPTAIGVGEATRLTGNLSYKVGPGTLICNFVARRLACYTVQSPVTVPARNQAVSWSALPAGTNVIGLDYTKTVTDLSGSTTSPPIRGRNLGAAQIVASTCALSGSGCFRSNSITINVGVWSPNTMQVTVSPDAPVTLLEGEQVVFRAAALDETGDTVRTAEIHWRLEGTPPFLTTLDASVANQITLRLSRSPLGQTPITAFVVRAPGDTVFGTGQVVNPAVSYVDLGYVGNYPDGVATNSASNRVYVSTYGSGLLSVVDGAAETVLATPFVGFGAGAIGIDEGLNKIYVATWQNRYTLTVVDGSTNSVIGSINIGPVAGAIAVDPVAHRVYVTVVDTTYSRTYVPDTYLVTIDATTDAVLDRMLLVCTWCRDGALDSYTDTLPQTGRAVAFNQANGQLYVGVGNDDVWVIDPSSHSIVQSIRTHGSNLKGIAVDTTLNNVYVTYLGCGGLTPCDSIGVFILNGASNTVSAFVPFNQALGIAVDPNHHRVFVGNLQGPLMVFENGPSGLQSPHFIGTADQPHSVAVNSATGDAFISQPFIKSVARLRF